MKTYYLVAEKKAVSDGFNVFVSDNPRGFDVLKTFEAPSYAAAVKMFSFSVRGAGKAAFCGVDSAGEVFHGEAAA